MGSGTEPAATTPAMKYRFPSTWSLTTGAAVYFLGPLGCDLPTESASIYDDSDAESPSELDPDDVATLDVDERFDVPEGTALAWVDFGAGPIKVAYEVQNGEALWQGDIVLGDANDIAQASADYASQPDDTNLRSAIAHLASWPNGVIPYQIDVTGSLRDRVEDAIEDWNEQTVVHLEPRDPTNPFQRYVRFTSDGAEAGICKSALGMQAGFGPQNITLDTGCSTGSIRHELGHTVGLFHEHGRTDRDDSIAVNWANIHWWKQSQYYTYLLSGAVGLDFGPYDLASLMHYSSFTTSAHAVDPARPVMVRDGCNLNSTSASCTFSSSTTLSDFDIAGVTRQVTGAPGTFRLRNEWTDQCLRPLNGGRAPGTPVRQSSCSNTSSRRWYTWQPPGTTRRVLVNEQSRHCLGVDDDDNMVLVHCTGDSDHRYALTPTGGSYGERLIRGSDRCVRASTSGSNAYLSTSCNNTPTRRWFRD